MTIALEQLVADELDADDPAAYGTIVDGLRDTAEQIRTQEIIPDRKIVKATIQACEMLLHSAAEGEKVRAAIAAGALAAVVNDPRVKRQYNMIRDDAFPIDRPRLSEEAREINVIGRRELDLAVENTDSETSYGEALALAGMTPVTDADLPKLTREADLEPRVAPLTYDEMLERVYVEPKKPVVKELFNGYGLFNGGELLEPSDPEGMSEMVARVQTKLKEQKEEQEQKKQKAA